MFLDKNYFIDDGINKDTQINLVVVVFLLTTKIPAKVLMFFTRSRSVLATKDMNFGRGRGEEKNH